MNGFWGKVTTIACILVLPTTSPSWIDRYRSHSKLLDQLTPVFCALVVLYLFSIRKRFTSKVFTNGPLLLFALGLLSLCAYRTLLDQSTSIRSATAAAVPFEFSSEVARDFLSLERNSGFFTAASLAENFRHQWYLQLPTRRETLDLDGIVPGEAWLVCSYLLIFVSIESALALVVLSGLSRQCVSFATSRGPGRFSPKAGNEAT